jgi:hypothetical protein
VARLGRKPFQRLVGKCDAVLRRNRRLYAETNEALAEMLGPEGEGEGEGEAAGREEENADGEAAIETAQMGLSTTPSVHNAQAQADAKVRTHTHRPAPADLCGSSPSEAPPRRSCAWSSTRPRPRCSPPP